jgi:hypothetical protein
MTSSEVDGRIAKQADIMTMSSLKRNDKLNMSAALRAHRYAHALVQFNDGAR